MNRRRRPIRLVVAYGVVAATVLAWLISFGGGTAAAATIIGTKVSVPAGTLPPGCDSPRVRNSHVEVCFQEDGDYFWVYDGAADGRSAYADWGA